ncbi:hypothetical protein MUO14_20270 [Halobacillus shinanisalinarum]|uniref:Uncharacterized protein n=1 Tax=Halobacillus shinanisalinarum TaxID=2932258 RepID=A0ABY4GX72_9BACI|nr:hypothetical protein [Halobacillus shinanisalinarum]UOQ92728.1 hypothetical protein MUO14_20270 [Halobacillus shinanisalinarum]
MEVKKVKKKKGYNPEGKKQLELDVDRMINEGMAGGGPLPASGDNQIGETHPIPKQENESHRRRPAD